MFIVQQKGEEIRAMEKDNRQEEGKKRKERKKNLLTMSMWLQLAALGFVQIMYFFYFSF